MVGEEEFNRGPRCQRPSECTTRVWMTLDLNWRPFLASRTPNSSEIFIFKTEVR
jgi:hypothetical protein